MIQTLTARAAWISLARTVGFILSMALPLVVVRQFEKSDFGLYKQLFLVINSAVAVVPLGFGMSVLYFFPRERDRQAHLIVNVLLVTLILGMATLALFSLTPSFIAHLCGSPQLMQYSAWAGFVILLWIIGGLFELFALARSEIHVAAITIVASQTLRAALMVIAALLYSSVRAMVVAASVHGILLATSMAVYLALHYPQLWRHFDSRLLIRQLSYALPVGSAALLVTIQADLHNYVVSHHFGAEMFAAYAVGCFQLPLNGVLRDSVGSVTIPHFSRLQAEGRHHEVIELGARIMRKLSLVYFPVYAFLILNARDFILVLFTPRYESSWKLFAINLSLIPLECLMLDPIIRAYSEIRYFVLRLRIATTALLMISMWVVLHYLGLLGATTCVVVVAGAEKLITAAKLGRVLGATRQDTYLVAPVGRTAAAAAIAALTNMLLLRSVVVSTPASRLTVSGVLFLITYVISGLLLGILTPDDWQLARRTFASVGRKLSLRPSVVLENSESMLPSPRRIARNR
jgi:O-antigen/teichoic acid export membrane protein